MASAGIAQLKARLSGYLAAVKRGEEVVVTEHGQPVARIVQIRGAHGTAAVGELERAGLLRRPSRALPKGWASRRKPKDPDGAVRQALKSERQEGW